MKKILIFLGILIFGGIFIFFIIQKNSEQHKFVKIRINDKIINIEIASTPLERNRGLSGRESLGKDKGMLFVFDTPDTYFFTMRGMKFPLDFIWIRDNQIVGLTENVPVITQSLSSGEKVNYVLEVNAGTAQANGIKIGDRISRTNDL